MGSIGELSFSVVPPQALAPRGVPPLMGSGGAAEAVTEHPFLQSAGFSPSGLLGLRGLLAGLAITACAARGLAVLAQAQRKEAAAEDLELSRRTAFMPVALISASAALGVPAEPAFAQGATSPVAPTVDLPDRIKENPYDLIGMVNMDDNKEDRKEFYMKKQYRQDTYQVLKHMKISASLDKATPNMERWNKRVKEEMDDWVALYRRQGSVVGRQSYYSLYSAVNTLASHFTSYGPKFPFPNKKRPRFYELVNTTEKYLEKGK